MWQRTPTVASSISQCSRSREAGGSQNGRWLAPMAGTFGASRQRSCIHVQLVRNTGEGRGEGSNPWLDGISDDNHVREALDLGTGDYILGCISRTRVGGVWP